eukprot:4367060-Amphidinium_carterae.1
MVGEAQARSAIYKLVEQELQIYVCSAWNWISKEAIAHTIYIELVANHREAAELSECKVDLKAATKDSQQSAGHGEALDVPSKQVPHLHIIQIEGLSGLTFAFLVVP